MRKAVQESCLAARPDGPPGPNGMPMGAGGGGGDDPVAQACAFWMPKNYDRIVKVFRRRLDPKYEEYEEDIVPEEVCSKRELAACRGFITKGIDRSIDDPEKRYKERLQREREDEEKARQERREARKKKKAEAAAARKAAAAAAAAAAKEQNVDDEL